MFCVFPGHPLAQPVLLCLLSSSILLPCHGGRHALWSYWLHWIFLGNWNLSVFLYLTQHFEINPYLKCLTFSFAFGRVVSGCQPSLHRARDSDVRLAWEDASAAWVFYSWDTWPWRWCHSGNGHLYVFIACVLWSNTWLATTIKESNQLLHILTLVWRSVALTDTFIHVIV